MILRVLVTLLAHYRRHLGQLAMLLLGLWVASALWSSVQAVNATAKDSYARANALFSADVDQLTRRDGQSLTREDYLTLRRSGWPVSPMLEGTLQIGEERLTIIGIDPLTLPNDNALGSNGDALTAFLTPPWQTQLAPETIDVLGLSRRQAPGATPTVDNNQRLPPLTLRPELPPNTLVMDIAAAAALLDRDNTLSQLVTAPGALTQPPDGYRLSRAATLASPEQLTDSFHLNLTALALLSLVVGLFIVQAALGLAMEQRLTTLRTLRALGVPAFTLTMAILLELLVFGLVGSALGLASGIWLAAQLLPDVATTLSSLYQADVQRSLVLPWHYWVGSLVITLGGLLLAGSGVLWRAARLEVLALGQSQAWRLGYQRQLKRMTQGGAVVAVIAVGLALWLSRLSSGQGVLVSFGFVAALLLGSALCLPPLINGVLRLLQRLLHRRPLAHWAVADIQLQLPRLSLAMMALLIALATNLGVSSMVGGFRLTFLDWLDQRLAAPLYINASPSTLTPMLDWLDAQPDVDETLPTARGSVDLLAEKNARGKETTRERIALFGITPAPTITNRWPLLDTQAGRSAAWSALSTRSVFINEQMAVAKQLAPGDVVTLETPQGAMPFEIAAVYPDYGNPRQQILMPTDVLVQRFGGDIASIGLVVNESADRQALRQALADNFDVSPDALVDQQEIKRLATQIFERTFTITQALNALTLGVAALALFATLLAQARERQRQLASLWALGVPRKTLTQLPLFQLGGLSLLTGVVAIPLGIAITWTLVAIINVAAFGWRLPLYLFPWDIFITLLTALGVALAAAALPSIQLWRTSPQAMLNKGAV
ncbi:ABC transporter permease [Vreelandella arcis]|uniref:Putative ABC transport system permease protein n=1 Tax=Vreelandella arcis TaxID=416873 RepID=A0A1H0J4N5_9GAMM|nr:ABC transporter permease [Halomonas arcis]SDO38717.1 putative ABC transport system permease protein [Halomonas arcis]